ncbi:MAG: MFS transporter [Phenylobacterium sp.]|uniref:MFS transporter n=1 Tax=Phenylobacterium sp. TaxID=1871053 RepID=UPI0012115D65|nr:MFS transporter [Phenylobacterium sp.]TAJ69804.1 MAG: MFS transporter [Phenylobacterium sp.]
MAGAASSPRASGAAWWTVALLGLLYILSFVDRVILALLVAPLKADLGVSDLQLGLLFGPAFAVFYALVGLPIARLADRGDRRKLIVAGVLLWGLATVASGFAGSFWLLMVLRIGLAIGEAALTPSAYSLIGDLFPPEQRARAASIYSAAGMAGASGAYVVGAMVVQGVDAAAAGGHALPLGAWQLVLVIVGAPSLACGLLFALTVREPARAQAGEGAPGLSEVMAHLRARARLFVGLFAGAGLTQAVGYAYSAWGPELLRRQFDLSIQQAGYAFGIAGLLAGLGGTLAAPQLTRVLERRGRRDAVALTSMACIALGGSFAVMAPLQSSAIAFLVLHACGAFFLVGAANNVVVGLQALAPPRMRATFVALLLMCITLLGLGIGPTAAAAISSGFDPSGQALGPALSILAPAICLPAFLLFFWSRGGILDQPDIKPAAKSTEWPGSSLGRAHEEG